ncbi:hypothetical protein F5Y16DRAFT_412166 [Xylariaceae sp. FL0255]|nr:hypothetical protein F5Y16DRAFT_412166 [Xylariaceae sp. FL0255]
MVCTNDNSQSRLEWSDYADADRTAFVNAIKCLMRKPSAGSQYPGSQNRYEDLVAVHRDMLPNVHQTSSFLPWHRYFVWVFQQMLQEECGFTTPLPWWDETKNAGNFGASDLFSSQWFGELPLKTSSGQGTCVSNGAFANITLHIGPGDSDTNHCLSRGEAREDTKQCNSDYVNSCLSQSAFGDFSTCLELGPHGYGHNGIGAVMSDVASAVGDPIFFMHHSFVDHTFRLWQNANASRLTTISGCADAECTPITLDYVLSSGGLAPNMTVGNALNTLSTSLCYRYDY